MKINSRLLQSYTIKYRTVIVMLAFGIAVLLPLFFRSSYLQGIITKIVMYAIIASGLNIINGYSGQTNFGMAGFMCCGSYMAAILCTRFKVPSIICILCGALFAGFVGYLISLPTLKLQGSFLVILTLGFSEMIRLIVINWQTVTKGTMGIKGIPVMDIFGFKIRTGAHYYWFVLLLLSIVLFCLFRLINSRVGRAWISIREDQEASRSLGVEVSRYKSICFTIGCLIAGLGGSLMLFYYRYTSPDMFMLEESFNILVMVTIGGSGTLLGPILGSILINFITEAFRFAAEFRFVLYALLIIGTMWLRPQGLVGDSDSIVANSAGLKLRKRKV